MMNNNGAKNGYEAISHVSQCFGDIQEYTTRLEKELRELECANDELSNQLDAVTAENDQLKAELKNAADVDAKKMLPELMRWCMDQLEKAPAERIKKYILDLAFIFVQGFEEDGDDEE